MKNAAPDITVDSLNLVIDQKALAEVASRQLTIDQVRTVAQQKLQKMVQSKQVDTENASIIRAKLDVLQSERMREVRGDASVHLIHEPDSVLGHFDGDQIYLDVTDGITESTYDHEKDHEKKGFIPELELDEAIADDVKEELHPLITKGVSEDDELLSLVQRDPLERSATEAGGETPAAYQTEHVDPTNRVVQRMNEAGLDGEAIIDKLIVDHNVQAYRDAVKRTLIHESFALAA